MENDAAGQIVVGVDGSESSVEALRWAARLVPVVGGNIRVVAAWEYPPEYVGFVPHANDDYEDLTRRQVDRAIAEAFGGDVPQGLTKSVVFGHPSKVLVQESRDAAMLVVGRRGHGGFKGLLVGSVSSGCVSHATCPVLVIHEHPDAGRRERSG